MVKSLAQHHLDLADGCWVDFYEGAYFDGKLRRVRGPADVLRTPRFGSVVVGPQARIVWEDNKSRSALQPKQIIPDARKRFGGRVASFRVVRAG